MLSIEWGMLSETMQRTEMRSKGKVRAGNRNKGSNVTLN